LHSLFQVRCGRGGPMRPKNTRRDFLKLSGVGVAALATGTLVPEKFASAEQSGAATGDISIWITAGEQRLQKQPPSRWKLTSGVARPSSISVDPGKSFQAILGF